jgi:hypothetical protein
LGNWLLLKILSKKDRFGRSVLQGVFESEALFNQLLRRHPFSLRKHLSHEFFGLLKVISLCSLRFCGSSLHSAVRAGNVGQTLDMLETNGSQAVKRDCHLRFPFYYADTSFLDNLLHLAVDRDLLSNIELSASLVAGIVAAKHPAGILLLIGNAHLFFNS